MSQVPLWVFIGIGMFFGIMISVIVYVAWKTIKDYRRRARDPTNIHVDPGEARRILEAYGMLYRM